MEQTHIHTTAEAIADKANALSGAGGASVALYGWFTLEQWFMFAGLVITFASFCVGLYFKHKHFELEREVAKARITQINNTPNE